MKNGSWRMLLVGVMLYVAPATGEADEPIPVVILHSGQDPLVAALKAEVSSSGFTPVVVAVPDDTAEMPSLEAVSREEGTIAGIRVMPTGRGVEVWVSDAVSGVNVATEVVVDKKSDRTGALVALKAVELLRASFMKIEKETPKEPSPPQVSEKPEAPPAPPLLALDLEPSITWGAGELPVTMHLHISLRLRLGKKGLGLLLFGRVPTFPMKITETEGSADIRVGLVAVGLLYEFLPPEKRLHPQIGAAVGPGFMRMRGHAKDEYIDGHELLVFAVGHLFGGLSVAINRVLSFRADAALGWAINRPVVGFGDRKITGWGRPIVSGMLGIEAWIF